VGCGMICLLCRLQSTVCIYKCIVVGLAAHVLKSVASAVVAYNLLLLAVSAGVLGCWSCPTLQHVVSFNI
jgi:hypothetical protein